ncbi:MAG: glutamine amidotransferase [Stellaceae bacterium]
MKQAVALRHVAFEDLDGLRAVLEARGYGVSYSEAPSDDLAQPALLDADLLIVLGGPIGAYDCTDYPFLAAETELIARRLAAGRRVLGLCLGAQLMAQALGARVFPAGGKEIGWAPVSLSAAGRAGPLRALDRPVLHWHGDTFDLPPGALHLASTDLTPNQAFAVERHGLGLQFHIETTARGLERWYVGHAVELAQAGISIARLRADAARYAGALVAAGSRAVASWLENGA